MRSSLLCALCLASFALVAVKAQDPDPAYAVLLSRLISSLPTMVQSQLDGKPENLEKSISKILGDGLLGRLLSDPLTLGQELRGEKVKDGEEGEDDSARMLWSSFAGGKRGRGHKKHMKKENQFNETESITMNPVISSKQPGMEGETDDSPVLTADLLKMIDEKKLAEALLEVMKKSSTPSPMNPAEYAANPRMPSVDFSMDPNKEYLGRQDFRRAPTSDSYRYGMRYSPSQQAELDQINQEALLAYASALRGQQQASYLPREPLAWSQQQQSLGLQPSMLSASNAEQLTPEEAIRVHEILNAYDAKMGRQVARTTPRMMPEVVEEVQQVPMKVARKEHPSKEQLFPDMTSAEKASMTESSAESVKSAESDTLASAFEMSEPQLKKLDSDCGCVPLELAMMEGDWVQALGHSANVNRIYKGALQLLQKSNKTDIKPTCARFKFENVMSTDFQGVQEAKMKWTFRTSENSKAHMLRGTVVSTDYRTVQLQLEGPDSYKFNLPVCAQKTGMSKDGDKYSFVVLTETVGKDKCKSAHVLVRNPAAFFHERNEELINFLKTRIENDDMKPVSVVPFGDNCD